MYFNIRVDAELGRIKQLHFGVSFHFVTWKMLSKSSSIEQCHMMHGLNSPLDEWSLTYDMIKNDTG